LDCCAGSLAALVRETYAAAQTAQNDDDSSSAFVSKQPRIPTLSIASQDALIAQLNALLCSGKEKPSLISAVTYSNLGMICHRLGWNTLALKAYNVAKWIRMNLLDQKSPEWIDVGATLNNIGVCCHELKRYQEALLYFNGAHQALGQWLHKAHPRMSVAITNVAKAEHSCRDYRVAGDEKLYKWQVQPDELNMAVWAMLNKKGGGKKKKAGGKKKKK
jgi:tetratricopeptide (TPR) repeat protein